MAELSADSATRPSLLLRIRDPRDAASWDMFVTVYTAFIFGQCRRRLQHADAEDVTQRVFVRIHQAIRNFQYDPARGSFRGWLRTLTHHEWYQFLQQQARQARPAGDAADLDALQTAVGPPMDDTWDDDFRRHVIDTALARIRPHFEEHTWRAFERTERDQAAPKTVAAEMGRTVSWVYMAKCRVRARLKEEIRELAEGGELFDKG